MIKDPNALTVIAAQQWGIDSLALPSVLEVLQEVDYITIRRDKRGKIKRIHENIPLLQDNLYESLGTNWQESQPTELDQATVGGLELLAEAPIRHSELTDHLGDETVVDRLLQIGDAAQFAKRLELDDGDSLIWSPYCGYEKPEALVQLFSSFDENDVREQFARVRGCQGLPLDGAAGILKDAVGQGILLANSIVGTGGPATFAFVPYGIGPTHLRMEKNVLEKAMVLLACVRYGEGFARHRIRMPSAILEKLRDGGGLGSNSEASTQYRSAADEQIVRLEDEGGGYYTAKLIDTPDNKAAVALALDLLTHGEPMTPREDPDKKLLFTDGEYLTPLMTMKKHKPKVSISGDNLMVVFASIRGDLGG